MFLSIKLQAQLVAATLTLAYKEQYSKSFNNYRY